jgi:hypothetical protein
MPELVSLQGLGSQQELGVTQGLGMTRVQGSLRELGMQQGLGSQWQVLGMSLQRLSLQHRRHHQSWGMEMGAG